MGDKPASITVVAVLNILFGLLCGGAGALGILVAPISLQQGMFPEAYIISTSILSGISFLLWIAMITAGAGLLLTKDWGRKTSLFGAIGLTVIGAINAVLEVIFVMPMVMNMQAGNGNNEAAYQAGVAIGGAMGTVCGVGFALAYPLTVIYLMTRQNVKDALNPNQSYLQQPPPNNYPQF